MVRVCWEVAGSPLGVCWEFQKWSLLKCTSNELSKLRPVWTLQGSSLFWESSGSRLGVSWESGGSPVGIGWEAAGRPMGGRLEAAGRPLGGLWEAAGRPLGVCWEFQLSSAYSSNCYGVFRWRFLIFLMGISLPYYV
jgi:hypothetical protein